MNFALSMKLLIVKVNCNIQLFKSFFARIFLVLVFLVVIRYDRQSWLEEKSRDPIPGPGSRDTALNRNNFPLIRLSLVARRHRSNVDLHDRVSARCAVVMATPDAVESLSRGPTVTIERDPQHGNFIERQYIHTGILALEPHVLFLSLSSLFPLFRSRFFSCVNTFPTPTSDACASRNLISPSLSIFFALLYFHFLFLFLVLF